MGCEYETCPAKAMIDNLVKDKDKMEDKVDKIEGKLTYHMTRSEEKHNQLLEKMNEVIDTAKETAKFQSEALKTHTDDEMEVQRANVRALESNSEKLATYITKQEEKELIKYQEGEETRFRSRIMWIIVSSAGGLVLGALGYSIKLILDVLVPN